MDPALYSAAATILHMATVGLISFRVIMRKPAVGVALAWLFLVAAIPVAGAAFYLLVGERRVGQKRARRIAMLRMDYPRLAQAAIESNLTQVDWSTHRPAARAMDRLGMSLVGVPTVGGSTGRLLTKSDEILRSIAADIDAAHSSVLMEFYIWNEGGLADDVVASLVQAVQRGVECRVLVDAVGARPWWRGKQPALLRNAGVKVEPAMPAGVWQAIFARNDLRLHRKIVVIDGRIAWTGSMNLVDPRYFKQDANVGQWIDAMVRAEGAVVAPLAMTMIGDWVLETNEPLENVVRSAGLHYVESKGSVDAQVIPSGPTDTSDGVLQMLLALINSARDELVLTTPYFIPDDSLMRALRGAAARGVRVDLVLPEKVDSLLARYASRSYYDELMDVGVNVYLYRNGLLHTKSAVADRNIAMFGTANFDMRSLWLNFEVSVFVYGEAFGNHLHEVQQSYLAECDWIDPLEWSCRPLYGKFLENVLRLVGPVL